MAYVGETRARKMRAFAVDAGFGLVVQRGRVGKAAIHLWPSYFYDNLAFSDWRNGTPFDDNAFSDDVAKLAAWSTPLPEGEQGPAPLPPPEFCVLPDRVAAGLESLALSMTWLDRLQCLGLRWALAVQDGMAPADIPWSKPFCVVFVGGSLEWKKTTAGIWADEAHKHGKRCHVGRVGNKDAVRWAADLGADSVDTAQCLWAMDSARRYRGAIQSANKQLKWSF